ncbi:MAG: HesA/MoeB/ThiF family protein [Rikenellaceae bacterium]
MLTENQKERYLRQIALEELGEQGQLRLSNSSALIVGVGGLGSPIATLLTSAGFGRIGIIDYDVVSLSNLPRQTLYTTEDIGLPKVECAVRRLSKMNNNIKIDSYNCRFDDALAEKLLENYDIIIDGCDNMETRYIIDRAAKKFNKPYIYGAISGFLGQVSVFHHKEAGSYSDLFPEDMAKPASKPPAVMATTPAIIGAIQANEAFKIAIGYGETLSGRLLTFDNRDYSLNILDI